MFFDFGWTIIETGTPEPTNKDWKIDLQRRLNKFLWTEFPYFFDTEKTPGGEILYGKDKKYSFIQFAKEDEVLKGDYGFYQIYYENGTGKIVSIAGIDKMTNKDSCLQKRKVDVDLYTKKNRITSLFNKNQDKHTFPDGMIDDYVQFFGDKKFFSFSCYIYPGQIEYRVEAYENNYNDYVFKKWNES